MKKILALVLALVLALSLCAAAHLPLMALVMKERLSLPMAQRWAKA